VAFASLLGDEGDTAVLAGHDTDGLSQCISPMILYSRVCVVVAVRKGVPCRQLDPHTALS
jgi:hypothetical protein